MRVTDVIAPMKLDDFRDAYLNQSWVVIEGPRERYEPLIPWKDLNAALNRLRIPPRSRRVRLVRDGKEIPPDTYLRHGVWGSVIRTGALERELSEGATLVLNGVDELFPEVRDLTNDVDEQLGGFAWANMYAGWRTQKGFDLHWDDHDTLIVQVYGRKSWTVYRPTCENPTKAFSGSWTPPEDEPVWEGILEAGSVLYMPRGWWHFAVPLDEPTLHITVGLRALAGEDLLHWASTQLHAHPVFRGNIPYQSSPETQQAYLSELRDAVLRTLSDGCLDRMRQHARARTPRFPEPALPDAIMPEPSIGPESLLLLAGAREVDTTAMSDGRLSVVLGAGKWTCSRELAGAMGQLNAIEGRKFEEISAGLSPLLKMELKILLTAMLHQGEVIQRPGGPLVSAGSVAR